MKMPLLRQPFVARMKQIYICMLAVYAVLRDVVPLYYAVSGSIFSVFFFGAGILLIAADILDQKNCLRSYGCDSLLMFLVICGVSTVVNYRYGLVSNFKAMGWMFLYYFLIYSNDGEKREKTLPALFRTFSVTMTVLILISLPMYFFDIGYTYYKPEGTFTDQGFSFLYARLWGVFHEANYAAVYTEIALFASVYLALQAKTKGAWILTGLQTVLFVSFIVLTGSRTASLVLLLSCVWMGFYVAFHRNAWGGMKRFMTAAGSGILAAVVVYVVLQCVSLSLPYMKVGVQKLAGTQFSYDLHLLYDDAYRLGRVNIKESSTDRLFEVQEPSSLDGENEELIVQATEPQTVKPIHRTDLDDPDISNGRFNRWKNGLEIFCASPILGTSPRGVYAFAKDHCPETYVAKYSYSISNSVIELLACSGLAGAIAMLGFLLASAIHIVKNAVTKTFDQETMILTGTIVLIVCASVLESDLFFLLTISGVLFWFILGTLNGNAQGKMPLSFRLLDKMTKRKNK